MVIKKGEKEKKNHNVGGNGNGEIKNNRGILGSPILFVKEYVHNDSGFYPNDSNEVIIFFAVIFL